MSEKNYTVQRVLPEQMWFRGSLNAILKPYGDQIDTLTAIIKASKVETDDQLASVENNVRKLSDIKKAIEAIQKQINDPFNKAKKEIKSEIDVPLLKINGVLTKINSVITSYKTLKLAQSREEAKDVKSEGITEIKNLKESADDLIYYILVSVKKLFGGSITTKKGVSKYIEKPATLEEFNAVVKEINDRFPDSSTFHEDIREIAIDFSVQIIKTAEFVRENCLTTEFEDVLKTAYAQKIPNLMKDFEIKQIVSKKEQKLEKTVSDMTTSKGTGLRTDIEFSVMDPNEVPRDYLSVDNSKVNAYKRDNRDAILKLIKEGKALDIIPGIKFTVKQQTIIR